LLPHPGEVGDGGARVRLLERGETAGQGRLARDARGGVVRVAEDDGLRRAGLGAGGRDLAVLDLAVAVPRLPFGEADALHAEGALLHDALRAHRDVRVELQLERLQEAGVAPVEGAHLVRAVVGAVAGADAAVVDLRV